MTNIDASNALHDMPLNELRARARRALALIAELKELFPDLIRLSEMDRKYSVGRMRRGEPAVLRSVLDAVELQPEYFRAITIDGAPADGAAPRREGAPFDVSLLRDRLERRQLLEDVADALEPLTSGFSDTVLHLGGEARPAIFAAYRAAKTLAQRDGVMRAAIGRAMDFFAAPVRRRGNFITTS
jgi:hypothetical protein